MFVYMFFFSNDTDGFFLLEHVTPFLHNVWLLDLLLHYDRKLNRSNFKLSFRYFVLLTKWIRKSTKQHYALNI